MRAIKATYIVIFAAAFLARNVATFAADPNSPSAIVIKNAKVFDGTSDKLADGQTILVIWKQDR